VGYLIAAAVILGLVGLFLAVATGLRCHYSRQERLAADSHYGEVRRMLDGPPPPDWDACVVRDPKNPQQGESP
jgi:hypothetical protein